MEKVHTVKIAGPAGFGIKSGGQLLSKIFIASGFNVHDYNEYPSLVRGGHNTYQVSFSKSQLLSPHFQVDLFFSIASSHWQNHQNEFVDNTLVFSDENIEIPIKRGIFVNLPLKDLVTKLANPIVANTICLGVVAFIYDLNQETCRQTIKNQFGDNAPINFQAFDLGYQHAEKNYAKYQRKISSVLPKTKEAKELYDGNEAYGWGFLKAGGNFYAAYPMTPATGALHFLATRQKDFDIKVIHPEDEIAAASIAAGAAFAGARAAVGTSGGGFALMNETVSFCGVAEIGVVFYLVSRPGPATGLPTWTSQGDLLHAVNSGHGEFPKVVLAPSSQQESFEFSGQALNIAAKYQLPVIVISDKFIAESSVSLSKLSDIDINIDTGSIITKKSGDFHRYAQSDSGVSASSLPGTTNAEYLSNSYEHDELGYSTEDPLIAQQQMDKRQRKIKSVVADLPKATLLGNSEAKNLIITWGSSAGPTLEALKELKNNSDYAVMIIRTLWPIDPELENIINKYQQIIVVENNQTAQMLTLLKTQFNINPQKIITKYNGRPFFPEELLDMLSSLSTNK